jgi:hypothetical protein
MSIDEFYEQFFSSENGIWPKEFYLNMDCSEVKTTAPWKKNKTTVEGIIPVQGVPFIKSTRAIKEITIVTKNDTELIVEFTNKALDAPYSDCFVLKLVWVLLSGTPDEQRSILLMKQKVEFSKKPFLYNTIKVRALEGQANSQGVWMKYVTEKGYFNKRPPKPRASLKKPRKVILDKREETEEKILTLEVKPTLAPDDL